MNPLRPSHRRTTTASEQTSGCALLRERLRPIDSRASPRYSGGEMTISFQYELMEAGRRLRASEQLRGTDHDQDNVWIFERR